MKKLLITILLSALILAACAPTVPNEDSNISSAIVSSSSSTAAEDCSISESTPYSITSSTALSNISVTPHYLLNVNTANDVAFLLHMKYDVAKKYWDEKSAKITVFEDGAPSKFGVELESGIYLRIDQSDNIGAIDIDYTKLDSRDAVSLIGLNGYETFDSITEKFGKELIYPYNANIQYGLGDEIIEDVEKDMCSMILSGAMFYRADFDENGLMTKAFIAPKI